MHPVAPISAVPRELVRDRRDIEALAVSIAEFLLMNREKFRSRRLIFDFRTPAVPAFVISALDAALKIAEDSGLQEVVILEM